MTELKEKNELVLYLKHKDGTFTGFRIESLLPIEQTKPFNRFAIQTHASLDYDDFMEVIEKLLKITSKDTD